MASDGQDQDHEEKSESRSLTDLRGSYTLEVTLVTGGTV